MKEISKKVFFFYVNNKYDILIEYRFVILVVDFGLK